MESTVPFQSSDNCFGLGIASNSALGARHCQPRPSARCMLSAVTQRLVARTRPMTRPRSLASNPKRDVARRATWAVNPVQELMAAPTWEDRIPGAGGAKTDPHRSRRHFLGLRPIRPKPRWLCIRSPFPIHKNMAARRSGICKCAVRWLSWCQHVRLSRDVLLQGGVPQHPGIGPDLRCVGRHWHQLARRTQMLPSRE